MHARNMLTHNKCSNMQSRSGTKENLKTRLLQDPVKEFLCLHHAILLLILKECLIIPEPAQLSDQDDTKTVVVDLSQSRIPPQKFFN